VTRNIPTKPNKYQADTENSSNTLFSVVELEVELVGVDFPAP
jgi:hypothetical protein